MNKKHIANILERALLQSGNRDEVVARYIMEEYTKEVDRTLAGIRRVYPDMDLITEDILLSVAEMVPNLITAQLISNIIKRTGSIVLNETILKIMATNLYGSDKNINALFDNNLSEILPIETFCAFIRLSITERFASVDHIPMLWALKEMKAFDDFRSWLVRQYIQKGGDATAFDVSKEFMAAYEAEKILGSKRKKRSIFSFGKKR